MIAAASVISGCTLISDFDTPIPADDTGADTATTETSVVDTGVDSFVDTGVDTEVDTGTDAGEDTTDTSVDAADADETSTDAADADETATDAADADETSTDAADADETSTDAADADDTAIDAADADETATDAGDDATDATDADDADAAETDTAPMCTTGADCPGVDTECMTRTCTSGVCGFSFAADGFAVSAQTAGDCKKVVCDGAGATKPINDDLDLPVDSNDCTDDVCTSGIATNPPKGSGVTCTSSGGKVCNGAGACVGCMTNTDCTAPATCNTTTHTCVAPSCTDTIKNGDESDVDCGGSCTTKCALGKTCGVGTDCDSGSCSSGTCVAAASCTDTIKNGTETDVDCGGSCTTKCSLTKTCATGTDCASTHCVGLVCVECESGGDCTSGVCTGNACATASCADTVKNGSETDVDCGGSCTTKCALTMTCSIDGDCTSGHCVGSVCVECVSGSECPSTICTSNACVASSCTDTVKNGTETDVDCGGTVCTTKCALTKTCSVGADCASNHCVGSVCVECETGTDCPSSGICTGNACAAASCTDTVKNGTETDVDCGGGCSKDCEVGQACSTGADCESGICTSSVCAAPSVASTTPADAANGVATLSTITVTFAGAMDGTTLTTQSTDGPCTGNVQVSSDGFTNCIGLASFSLGSSNTVATWTPAGALSFGTSYKVRVTTGAKDGFGNALGAQYASATGFTTAASAACSASTNTVVISQVYGGAFSGGAAYKRDYIELHNRGTTAVNLSGWSVQYGSSTGVGFSAAFSLTGTIPAGGYFLVVGPAGTDGLEIAGDQVTTLAMNATTGKVGLVNGTTQISTAGCPGSIIDLVGYNTGNCFEGAGKTPAPSIANAVFRRDNGCSDTNENAVDFFAAPAAPRNASTAPYVCPTCVTRNESGVASEADYCVIQPAGTDYDIPVAPGGTTRPIYGRVYEGGVTDPVGAPTGVVAEVGYGPLTVNPTTQSGWTWTAATWNAQYGNDDEFNTTLTAPSTKGTYRYAYRFSLDGGTTWTYCDKNGAGSNGGLSFEVSQLPTLNVTDTP